ncbi:MAG: branched-chain amino acid ABC transporter substrate-binding protein [Proteobacteria bacterium]|nr:branched-chain amino acid ABC transporter substrate-binding protein [Pseudomonadota bacterium]
MKSIAAAAVVGAGALAAAPAMSAEVDGVMDDLRVVKIRAGEPITIGVYEVLSGPDTALGLDQWRGIQVAASDAGDKVAGHAIRFLTEDTGCNAEGGQTAATKIAANTQTVIALGGSCSSATTPAAPILWKAGIPNISTSASSPALTAPDRGPGYDGFVRVIYNDNWAGKEVGDWAVNVMGFKRFATIHDGSPYAEKLVRVFQKRLVELGAELVSDEAVSPTDVDMRPVLTKIATSKPDLIYSPTFVAATAYMLRQKTEIAGLEKTMFVGSDASFGAQLLEAAGKDVVGYKITTTAQEVEAQGEGYPAMREKYKEMFGEYPIQGFHGNGYDAFMMAKNAIEKVAVVKDGATYIPIAALTAAVKATKDHNGMTGMLTCDQYGDCAVYKFAVYEFNSDDKSTLEMGKNPKRIYPEKF